MYGFSELAEKIENQELHKLNEKLFTLYVQIAWIYRKSECCGYIVCIELCKFNGKLCTLYV